MTKRARTIPADAPAALVIGDKVTAFDPTNPAHLDWLEVMLGLLREKYGATKPYPPAFDEVISAADLVAWDKTTQGQNGVAGTRAWRAIFTALNSATIGRPWVPTMLHTTELRAGVIPLGLLAAKGAPWSLVRGGDRVCGKVSADFITRYLIARGLRLGMDTRAWLQQREKTFAGD